MILMASTGSIRFELLGEGGYPGVSGGVGLLELQSL